MKGRLDGKVALVTGAGTGIGLATVNRLSAEGAKVVAGVLDITQQRAIASHDAEILDVRSEAAWNDVLQNIESRYGRLDILINNAGIHRIGDVTETTRNDWEVLLEVNLYGTFLGCRHAIAHMRPRGGGSIVNLSSFAALRGVPRQVAYATTKGGILAMTLALAVDCIRDGIRVNCVCPGATETAIIDNLAASNAEPEQFRKSLQEKAPMGRMAKPAEIAAAIAYLASDDAAFITGIALPVDGGRSGQ